MKRYHIYQIDYISTFISQFFPSILVGREHSPHLSFPPTNPITKGGEDHFNKKSKDQVAIARAMHIDCNKHAR